ncbi:hypothetical protein PQI23_00700 [Leucobacter sp. USCH14]|uniref:hypothetical protein n=1 Tax=Leucobacter sp. USCH14 TaxID=3024838 RepID=UPI0030A75DE5
MSDPGQSDDETVVTPRRAASEPLDETVVTPRRAVPASADETVVTPRAAPRPAVRAAPSDSTAHGGSTGVGASRNPAPPVDEPPPRELPPELAARMFKSPLDARYRVPEAPSPAPDHALPRRGVSPALPVITSQRTGRRSAAGTETDARFGPPPASRPAPPPADRAALRSTVRANRRFGIGALAGFAGTVVIAIGGLWLVAVLAFG